MALIGTISTNQYIGNPIIVPVTAGSHSGASFHRVCLKVTVGGTGSGTFEFSAPVISNSTVNFDVSSAVRAVAEQYNYEAETPSSYPTYNLSLNAWDEWMKDGAIRNSESVSGGVSTLYAGTLTDYQRLFPPARYTRKPTTQREIVFTGFKFLEPTSATGVSSNTINSGADASRNIYGIAAPFDGYEIRFINSFGLHENVFVACLRTAEVAITTERYAISRQETLKDFSRGIAIKKNNHERWKMSTGPLDHSWQQWYLHEFLMAKWAWIGINSHYLPIHILPDDTVKGIDRQKASPMTVEFTIEFDMTGSPFGV